MHLVGKPPKAQLLLDSVLHLCCTLDWHIGDDTSRRSYRNLDTSDAAVNADLLEVLGRYEGMEPVVSEEQAQREFHRIDPKSACGAVFPVATSYPLCD